MDVNKLSFSFEHTQTISRRSASFAADQSTVSFEKSQRVEMSALSFSANRKAATAHADTLNKHLEINQQKPNVLLSAEDMREVARNVLQFVGDVLRQAFNDGEGDERIKSMVQHAHMGVEKGFKQALDILGMPDDDVMENIDDGYKTIRNGIDAIEHMLLDSAQPETQGDEGRIAFPTQLAVTDVAGHSTQLNIEARGARVATAEISISTSFTGYLQGATEEKNQAAQQMVSYAEELTLRFEYHQIDKAKHFIDQQGNSEMLWLEMTESGTSKAKYGGQLLDDANGGMQNRLSKMFFNDMKGYVETLLKLQQAAEASVGEPQRVTGQLLDIFSQHHQLNHGPGTINETNDEIQQKLQK